MSGMDMIVVESEGKKPVIILIDEMRDQAALMGILITLYDMCSRPNKLTPFYRLTTPMLMRPGNLNNP